jgi:hypothetical protein
MGWRVAKTRGLIVFVAALLALAAGACVAPRERKVELHGSRPAASPEEGRQPTIAASPTEEGAGGWQVAAADAVTLTVTAPGASEVTIFYRPVVSGEDDDYLQLKKLIEPTERASGRFQTNLQTSADFAGDVWARVAYPGGEERQTNQIALTTRTAVGASDGPERAPNANDPAPDAGGGAKGATASNGEGRAPGEDESARSDKATGGRVVSAALRPNDPDLRITVNVPAFLLTLWQGEREVARYHVGVGRKEFPIPVGERRADKIILNPAWIPPDSAWVRRSSEVEPYERVPADDPRNPLGKIKIPLGDAYLIHEAAKPSDIGSLVSHGCIRMLTEDIFDLTRKIARARGLGLTAEELEAAREGSERRVVPLGEPLVVDINYDTEVVEGGTLHLYPDVYERGAASVERLREELRAHGVDDSRLDDAALKEMIGRTSRTEKFVVGLSDLKRGRALEAGRAEPLVAESPPAGRGPGG